VYLRLAQARNHLGCTSTWVFRVCGKLMLVDSWYNSSSGGDVQSWQLSAREKSRNDSLKVGLSCANSRSFSGLWRIKMPSSCSISSRKTLLSSWKGLVSSRLGLGGSQCPCGYDILCQLALFTWGCFYILPG
jgi:hypothetical protein